MPPARQVTPRNGRLPSEPTSFVGRGADLAILATLLSGSRLVTITGLGGVGKTRLAIRHAAQVAGQYRHGVVFAELSGLRDPDLLPLSVASAVGLGQLDDRSAMDSLIDYLRDRELLLILDTCEHLVDACALLAETLLLAAPGVTILATSRQPLDTPGESACPLAPLEMPRRGSAPGPGDAGELFAQRASAAVAGFQVTDRNREQIIQLCQRLEGIPLAIELAAVRLRALSIDELTRRLEPRLPFLEGGRRSSAPRHQALRDTIGWSYELCTPEEQTLWNRLSVFTGPFTAQAAQEICGGGALPRDAVIDTLISLVDKSVLVRQDEPDSRYRMLDTLREYGAERLDETGTGDQVRSRLLMYYKRLIEELDSDPITDQISRYRTLRAQHENVRAALRYGFGIPGQEQAGAAMATSLYWYCLISGELTEARHWTTRVLENVPGPSPVHALALLLKGLIVTAQGTPDAGIEECERGLAMAEDTGSDRVLARGYFYYCEALVAAERLEEALAVGQKAQKLMAKAGDSGTAEALRLYSGLAHLLTGNLDTCYGLAVEGLRRMPADGSERWLSSFLFMLSTFVLALQGEHDRAARALRRALVMRQELGDPMGMGYCLGMLGVVAVMRGRPEEGAWLAGAASPVWRDLGTEPFTGVPGLADLVRDAERAARAALGDDAWDATFERAARCPLEEAVELAGREEALALATAGRGLPDEVRPEQSGTKSAS